MNKHFLDKRSKVLWNDEENIDVINLIYFFISKNVVVNIYGSVHIRFNLRILESDYREFFDLINRIRSHSQITKINFNIHRS